MKTDLTDYKTRRHIEFLMNNGEKILWDDERDSTLLTSEGFNGPDFYYIGKSQMNGKVFQSSELLMVKRDQVSSIRLRLEFDPITGDDCSGR